MNRALKIAAGLALAAWSLLVLYAWQILRKGVVIYAPQR